MTNPALPERRTGRGTLRVAGALLLLVGAGGILVGAALFARGFLSDDMEAMRRYALAGILIFGAGGFLALFGVGALSAGFAGPRSRYVPGEAMPLGPDVAGLLSDDGGIRVIGRAADERPAP